MVNRVAPLVLGVVCALALGVAVRDFSAAARRATPPAAPAPAASGEAPPTALDDFAKLLEWPLFGGGPVSAGVAAPRASAGELPASSAPYRLFGIIASEGSAPRRAILGLDEASQRAYREGDAAPDGATVTSIEARAVVLSRNGQAELLKLPGDFTTSGDAAPLPGEGAPTDPEPPPEMELPEAAPAAPPPASAATPIERLRQRIEAARAAAARGDGPAPVFAPPAQ